MTTITELNDRSREVFRQIVDSYLKTGEPIGSRTVAKNLDLDLSPASVRNVMADLEEAGLLFAPTPRPGACPPRRGCACSWTACWSWAT